MFIGYGRLSHDSADAMICPAAIVIWFGGGMTPPYRKWIVGGYFTDSPKGTRHGRTYRCRRR